MEDSSPSASFRLFETFLLIPLPTDSTLMKESREFYFPINISFMLSYSQQIRWGENVQFDFVGGQPKT